MSDTAWVVTITLFAGGVIGFRIRWWRQARAESRAHHPADIDAQVAEFARELEDSDL